MVSGKGTGRNTKYKKKGIFGQTERTIRHDITDTIDTGGEKTLGIPSRRSLDLVDAPDMSQTSMSRNHVDDITNGRLESQTDP